MKSHVNRPCAGKDWVSKEVLVRATNQSQVWWYWSQHSEAGDGAEFEASLDYIRRPCLNKRKGKGGVGLEKRM